MKIVINMNRRLHNYEHDSNDIVYHSKGDAVQALASMYELLSEYGVVRVSDLYHASGLNAEYSDHRHGWTDIDSAKIEKVKDGYIIRMPKEIPLPISEVYYGIEGIGRLHNSNDIIVYSKRAAKAVLEYMDEVISNYAVATVKDLCEAAEIYTDVTMLGDYRDTKYGWTDISSARVEEVKNGYIIRMPKALLLD